MVVTGAWFGLLEMRHINFSLFFLIDKVFLDLGEAFDVILGHPLTTCWCFQHFYNQWKILFGMDSFPPSTSSLWTLWKGSCSWPRSVRDLDSCLRATDGGAGWNRPGGTRLKSQELSIDQAYSGKVDFTRGMWETAFGDQKSSCASTWVRTLEFLLIASSIYISRRVWLPEELMLVQALTLSSRNAILQVPWA